MSAGRDARQRGARRAAWFRVTAAASSAAVLSVLGMAGTSLAATTGATTATQSGAAATLAENSSSACQLGNGIKHVIELTFDNVHFFRDNPNVPSDLEMMPNLLNFIEGHGTMLSNNHTPLIAHTADDILTTLTGLYGDRQGMPISNSYRTFNPNGTTDTAGSFAYWTDPVFDTSSHPTAGHDTNPSMVYAPLPPATASSPVAPNMITPAPWVPYTRAGCDVGATGTANIELENTAVDIPKVFGSNSPEAQQLAADSDPFKDAETTDYVGVAVHCAQGSAFCSTAEGVKFNQTSPSPTAVSDLLPDEPGGYSGFQALFGHRYVAPQLGAGTANVMHNGYQVTNSAGNLVDLNGNEIDNFFTSQPGFPGFSTINAAQTLAYVADMQESGVPVTYGYISDIHGNEAIPALSGTGGACAGIRSGAPLGPGSACYVAQAQYYNAAFGTFFKRLAADGITPQNTLFVVSPDEGDHVAAANVGRAITPTPSTCDGSPGNLCTYPSGSIGELAGNLTGLLATQKSDTTPFTVETDSAPEFYVTGNPGPDTPAVRTLERDVGGITALNPYTNTTQPIDNYLADPTEEAILHMVNADPARTPTFAMFARPDYFLSAGAPNCNKPCVTQNPGFAYDHGDYAAEINTNWLGIVGPGVANLGLDGTAADAGPNSAGANSGQVTVPGSGTTGTWIDETDIRPTIMYLTGLTDDYIQDGRVITEILTNPNQALSVPGVTALGACYKQLNSSVGEFGTATLQAATSAIESNSAGDQTYLTTDQQLLSLETGRDGVAGRIKVELNAAAVGNTLVHGASGLLTACQALITNAERMAAGG